jgi:Tfp pilus assembly protein PilX
MKKLHNNQPYTAEQREGGWILISALVMITFLTAVGLSISGLVALQYQHTRREMYDQNAQLVAEAGIEQSVRELNTDNTFVGYTSTQTFFNNTTQGIGTFTTAITNNADNSKTISSIGNVYLPGTTTPYITHKVRVIVVGTTSAGFSVATGPGGLILDGGATITNASVSVGGTITFNSGNAGIGTYSNPVTVDAGNNVCPPGGGSSYPMTCTDGSQPITWSGNGNKSMIYGTVCATGQTSTGPNSNIQTGNGGAGLEVGCTPPSVATPYYDRMGQINAVTTTGSASSGSYACTGSNKTFTWPANLELTGNVTIGKGCNVTVDGNVYITGSLSIGSSATMTVANSAGKTAPVIITDGQISVGGSVTMNENTSGVGMEFISFLSANSCTTSTTSYCATITGQDLYNSQTTTNVSVTSSVNLPGMIFDAYWSECYLGGSGVMGAAAGQTVDIKGSGSVVFGTQLSSGSETWTITSYQPYY